jgi:L-iditol 2-dehydrogenase
MTRITESAVSPAMQAALLVAPERFELQDVPRPACPEGGLLLRVLACAICGSDSRLFLGRKRIKGSQEIDRRPLSGPIIGHEIAGRIVEVGAGVTQYRWGDDVVVAPGIACGACDLCRAGHAQICRNYEALGYRYPGGFAQYLAVPALLINDGSVNRIPPGTPSCTACLAEPLACTLNAQETMGIRNGDTVLIVGAGPMGSLHLLLARQRGASFIAISEPDAARRLTAKDLGADLVMDPASPAWASDLRAGTGGRGFSAAIFAVSSIAPVRQLFSHTDAGAYGLLTPGARVNFFAGLDPGDTALPLDVRALHYQAISTFGSVNSTPRQNADALHLIATKAVDASRLVTARLPLAKIGEAMRLAASPAHLKIIIEPE